MSVSGEWFRWSAYDLDCGIIVPAEGATYETYDPWEAFRKNEGKYRTVEQPYVPLLDLYRNIGLLHERGVRASFCHDVESFKEPQRGPRNEVDKAILEWVTKHGFLGILPVNAREIRCPTKNECDTEGTVSAVLKPRHYRMAGLWWSDEQRDEIDPTDPAAEEHAKALSTISLPAAIVDEWTSIASYRPLWWLRRFFLPVLYGPSVAYPEPFFPPRPNTPEFDCFYCEPLNEFLNNVTYFGLALKLVCEKLGSVDEKEHLLASGAYRDLGRIAQSAAPSFTANRSGRTEDVHISAGLLASYALMFLWDHLEGRRALECAVCGKHFVSDEFRATYCSATCRNTASKRRARARKAEQRGE